MNFKMLKSAFFSICFFVCLTSFPQSYSLQVLIKNQPDKKIILGSLRGDRFTPIDTTEGEVFQRGGLSYIKAEFRLAGSGYPGMYRVILGQTLYAQVMNEPPQQFDFIFNHEDIAIETDFNHAGDSIAVVKSEENKAWFTFKNKERLHTQRLNQLMQFINDPQNSEEEIQEKRGEYNIAMLEREEFINRSIRENRNLFAAKIMPMYHEPLLDAYLSEKERIEAYKNEYFNNLDFSDPALINTTYYTDKVIHYIQVYGKYGLTRQQQENEFVKAVDVVLANVSKNPQVYELVLDYIVRGFERLGLDNALAYIAENYSGSTCGADEKTTLERRLGAQKMVPGSIVPDFTMNDLNGDPVMLSQVLKEKTLILFWASWCPHCCLMIPELKKWLAGIDTNSFEVVAVSLDTSKQEWQNKVFDLSIESWFNLSDLKEWDGETAVAYNIYATPTMFLIDEGMKILGKPLTVKELKAVAD